MIALKKNKQEEEDVGIAMDALHADAAEVKCCWCNSDMLLAYGALMCLLAVAACRQGNYCPCANGIVQMFGVCIGIMSMNTARRCRRGAPAGARNTGMPQPRFCQATLTSCSHSPCVGSAPCAKRTTCSGPMQEAVKDLGVGGRLVPARTNLRDGSS